MSSVLTDDGSEIICGAGSDRGGVLALDLDLELPEALGASEVI